MDTTLKGHLSVTPVVTTMEVLLFSALSTAAACRPGTDLAALRAATMLFISSDVLWDGLGQIAANSGVLERVFFGTPPDRDPT